MIKIIVAGFAGTGKSVVLQEIAVALMGAGFHVKDQSSDALRNALDHNAALTRVLASGVTVTLEERPTYQGVDGGEHIAKQPTAAVVLTAKEGS